MATTCSIYFWRWSVESGQLSGSVVGGQWTVVSGQIQCVLESLRDAMSEPNLTH